MRKNNWRIFAILLSMLMLLSMFPTGILHAEEPDEPTAVGEELEAIRSLFREQEELQKQKSDLYQAYLAAAGFQDEDIRAIVTFSPGITAEQGQQIKNKILEAIPDSSIRNEYDLLIHGFSLSCKRYDMDIIRHIDGVFSVEEVVQFEPKMLNAVDMTGVRSVWNDKKLKGEGMVVAILDTGMQTDHPSMMLTDPSKIALTRDRVSQIVASEHLYGEYLTAKIPYAFNFADHNMNTNTESSVNGPHGQHCAGIVAGNHQGASIADTLFGVAPEAQLLNMKVFSDYNSGAYNDDVILAIEEAVKLGADVISMSLGSPSAVSSPQSAYAIAMQNAVEHGTMVVVANGNEGMSSAQNGDPVNTMGLKDSGIAGSPANAPAAFAVGSIDNTEFVTDSARWQVAGAADWNDFPLQVQKFNPGFPDRREYGSYEVVNCGMGTAEDYANVAVSGKTALVERGGNTFEEKIKGAEAAGATAVLVYQNEANAMDLGLNMAGIEPGDVSIPAFLIMRPDGLAMIEAMQQGSVTVDLTFRLIETTFPTAGMPSMFTSWGPTVDLRLKPEVSAPGGRIYSSVDYDGYENMSGTSMATPHVAGATALVKQALRQQGLDERPGTVKLIFMNTAAPVVDDNGMPYSVRQQGAGMIRVDRAIDNRVLASYNDNGEAIGYIRLNAFQGAQTKTITLRNYGDRAVKFSVPASVDAMTENTVAGAEMERVALTGAVTAAQNSVEIPAGGHKTLTFTFNPAGSENNFFEGYILLTSMTDGQPDLNIPFFGYNGTNWGTAEGGGPAYVEPFRGHLGDHYAILKPFMGIVEEDKNLKYWYPQFNGNNMTALYTLIQGNNQVVIAGNHDFFFAPLDFVNLLLPQYSLDLLALLIEPYDPDMAAFSPNGDGEYDTIFPRLALTRAVTNARGMIVDRETGEVVRELLDDHNMPCPSYFYAANGRSANQNMSWAGWDGMLYNPETGFIDTQAPDGDYLYRIDMDVAGDGVMQTVEMPFKLDTIGPVIEEATDSIFKDPVYLPADEENPSAVYFAVKASDEGIGISPTGKGSWDPVGDSIWDIEMNGLELNEDQFEVMYDENDDIYLIEIKEPEPILDRVTGASSFKLRVRDRVENNSDLYEFESEVLFYNTKSVVLYIGDTNQDIPTVVETGDPADLPVSVYNLSIMGEPNAVRVNGDVYEIAVRAVSADMEDLEVILTANGETITADENGLYWIPVQDGDVVELKAQAEAGGSSTVYAALLLVDFTAPEISLASPEPIGELGTLQIVEVAPGAQTLTLQIDGNGEEDLFVYAMGISRNPEATDEDIVFTVLKHVGDGIYIGDFAPKKFPLRNHLILVSAFDMADNKSESVQILTIEEGTTLEDALYEFDAIFAVDQFSIANGLAIVTDDTLPFFGEGDPGERLPDMEDPADVSAETEPTEPAETTAPDETEPAETEPATTDPDVTEPEDGETGETDPAATEPDDTDPEVPEPEPSEPEPSQTEESEPDDTEPTEEPTEPLQPEESEPEDPEPSESAEPEPSEPAETTDPSDGTAAIDPVTSGKAMAVRLTETADTAVLDGDFPGIVPVLPGGKEFKGGYAWPISGTYKGNVEAYINGVKIPLQNRQWQATLMLDPNEINIFNFDVTLDGEMIFDHKVRVIYDPEAPVVHVTTNPLAVYDDEIDVEHNNPFEGDEGVRVYREGKIWAKTAPTNVDVKVEVTENTLGTTVAINGDTVHAGYDQLAYHHEYKNFTVERTVEGVEQGEWILIETWDDLGNTHIERLQLCIDDVPPTIEIFRNPDKNVAHVDENPNFTYTVADNEGGSGLMSDEIVTLMRKTEDGWELVPYTPGEPLAEGTYRFTVVATDYAGNTTELSKDITVVGDEEPDEPDQPDQPDQPDEGKPRVRFNPPSIILQGNDHDFLGDIEATLNGRRLGVRLAKNYGPTSLLEPGEYDNAYIVFDPITGEILGEYPFTFTVVARSMHGGFRDPRPRYNGARYLSRPNVNGTTFNMGQKVDAATAPGKLVTVLPATGEARVPQTTVLLLLSAALVLLFIRRRHS